MFRNRLWPLGAIVIAAGVAAWLLRPDAAGDSPGRWVGWIWVLLTETWIPALYLLAAVGYGRGALRLLRPGAGDTFGLAPALGLATMLWLSHALGVLGLLQAGPGNLGAWLPIGLGLLLWAATLRFNRDTTTSGMSWGPALLCAAPAATVAALAAASAPGWLWESEFGGFDVLSYHLQLPREWIESGRIVPLEHCVYSWLPGYVEAAYYHLSVLHLPLTEPPLHAAARAAVSCQMLHAFMLIWLAVSVAQTARVLWPSAPTVLAPLAGVLCASIPWVIVTGTLAYNEIPALIFLSAGLGVCLDWSRAGVAPWKCGVALGALAASACTAKLTGVGAVALPLGVVALLCWRGRAAFGVAGTGIATGAVVGLPWLVRNWAEGGNPLFPFATGLFGSAHWSAEQVQRWTAAHRADLAPAEIPGAWMEMAFLHPQWAGAFFFGLAGIIALALAGRGSERRNLVILLVVVSVQGLFWTLATHAQSRFLIACAVPLSLLAVGGASSLPGRAAVVCAAAMALVASVSTTILFSGQRGGEPTAMIDGLAVISGAAFFDLPADQQAERLRQDPRLSLALLTDPTERIYLLGDSTPFYLLRDNVLWHTTWDRSPLGEAIRKNADDPAAWRRHLREQERITIISVNWSELHRLSQTDGWYDPAVTPGVVAEFLESQAETVQTFTDAQGRLIASIHRLRRE